ncbi:MAG: chemotaxis protein CheB [Bacteroidia bacterium]
MKILSEEENKGVDESFPIVAIGASAGWLKAISDLLQNIPVNTGMAFIYVQHLNPYYKGHLSSILAKSTKMKVQKIEDMVRMKPDNVYIIPYDKGIEVTDGHIHLTPRGSKFSTINALFTSLAETHKENVIGVILSGYGSDGALGLKAIKKAGGLTFAQDGSAEVGSMPNAAISLGVVDFVLSPKEIALELARLSKYGLSKQKGVA